MFIFSTTMINSIVLASEGEDSTTAATSEAGGNGGNSNGADDNSGNGNSNDNEPGDTGDTNQNDYGNTKENDSANDTGDKAGAEDNIDGNMGQDLGKANTDGNDQNTDEANEEDTEDIEPVDEEENDPPISENDKGNPIDGIADDETTMGNESSEEDNPIADVVQDDIGIPVTGPNNLTEAEIEKLLEAGNLVVIESPEVFSIEVKGVVEAEAYSEFPVYMELNAISGIPDTVDIDLFVNGQNIGQVRCGMIVEKTPFMVEGKSIIQIHLAGEAKLVGASITFLETPVTTLFIMENETEDIPLITDADDLVIIDVYEEPMLPAEGYDLTVYDFDAKLEEHPELELEK